jgi:diguanylate cyclase (GGDEF)-like protein
VAVSSVRLRKEPFFGNARAEHSRYGTSFAVLIIDLVRFKDTYGHEACDRILKAVARTIEANMRAYHTVGGWGGEEFMAIVSHVSDDNLRVFGRKLCCLVEDSFVEYEGNMIRVTVTIGMATAWQDDTIPSLLNRADEALYLGKRSGRNSAVFGGEEAASRIIR